MFSKKSKLLLFCLFLYFNTILPSIISGTLVKMPHGLTTVENIAINDTIIAYDQEKLSTATVTHLSSATTDTLIAITTKKGTSYACPDQQFFDPVLQQWIAAKDITTQNTFLDAQLQHCACLHAKTMSAPATKIYCITTTSPHNFFVTEQQLLTHNIFPIVVGIACLFGGGLEFAGLTIGTAALGSYVGVQLYKREKEKQKDKELSFAFESQLGNYYPDPNHDNKDNERKFNTITKTEFFKTMKKHYEHYKEDIYRTKTDVFGKKTKYIKWDHLHNDIEAYTERGKHLGSINAKTLKFYKPANPRNWIVV